MILDLATHIYAHYANISANDISENSKRLLSPYNAEDTLECLIQRLKKFSDFADSASELVTETKIVRIAYGLVTYMGQHPGDCWVWRMQDNESWAAFQDKFIKEQSDP